MIVIACGALGFSVSSACRKEIQLLRQFIFAMDTMESELQFRLSPLAQLSLCAAQHTTGCLNAVFLRFSKELENQICPNAERCMSAVISETQLPETLRTMLLMLSQTLGNFDVEGQAKGIINVRNEANRILAQKTNNLDVRLRGYQTLGLCAGVAIAILLI